MIKYSQLDFIKLATAAHNGYYNYSESIYVSGRDLIKIKCPVHGLFKQVASSHLNGRGCVRCSAKKLAMSKSEKIATNYVDNLPQIQKDRYDLSEIIYIAAKKKVTPICPKHGIFEIRADVFKKGAECIKCSYERRGTDKSMNVGTFVAKSNNKHDSKYKYEKITEFKNAQKKVIITCADHGDFMQSAYSHLAGNGCPKCSIIISKQEQEVGKLINSLISGAEFNVRSIISPKEIDIYIPSKKLAIEYCGIYWHSEMMGKDKNYHLSKYLKCKEQEIKLITVFEDEWVLNREIVKSRITNELGLTINKIPARKCTVNEITTYEAKQFLKENHGQGSGLSKYKLGLYCNNILVSVMTFSVPRFSKKYQWELSRFCSLKNTIVIGAAGKLFAFFVKHKEPKSVVSYADLRWGDGVFYKNLGFELSHRSAPNFFYFKNGEITRESRIKYQKYKLIKEGYEPTKTAWQIMQERGFNKIWDCGNNVWIYST